MASPFLRWAGSKRWVVQAYETILTREKRLIDPFLGAGAVPLWHGGKMLIGDVSPDLICTWRAIQTSPTRVIDSLNELADFGTTEECYYSVRGIETENQFEFAARFIYLNKLCFNGLYRVNSKGEFNVPYGGEERTFFDPDEICDAYQALKQAEIFESDFEPLINEARAGDWVYADPPYHSEKEKSFSAYSEDGFSEKDQKRLAKLLREANKRGAEILAHNRDTALIRELYGWAEKELVSERRSINSDGKGRKGVDCLLIYAAGQ